MALIETIGLRAVIENVQGYLAGAKQMELSDIRMAQAKLRLAQVSEATSIAVNKANDRAIASEKRVSQVISSETVKQVKAKQAIFDARRNLNQVTLTENAAVSRIERQLADVTDLTNRRIVQSEKARDAARKRVTASAKLDAAQQIKAKEALTKAEVSLDNLRAASARRIAAINASLTDAQILRQSRVTTAAIGVSKAQAAAAALAEASALRIGNAQKRAADAAKNSSSVVSAASRRNESALLGMQAAMLRAGNGISRVSGLFTPFAVLANTATRATNLLGSALIAVTGFSNRFAVALRFGTLAISAFAGAFIISQASDYEDQLVKIENLTNLNAESTGILSDKLLELSQRIPKSPSELSATAYQVLSSGIEDLNLALSITENSAKAASVAQSSSADVARTTTAVIKAYGEQNINAAQTTDILLAATREGRVEFADFSNEIGRLLGIAPALGIEFDELAAALAGLSNFLPASQAGTALLGVLTQIFSPSEAAKKTLLELGTSIEQLTVAVAEKGPLPALLELSELSGRNIAVFEKLFPEVRGLGGALLFLRDNGIDANRILENIRNSAGITEETFARATKTFSAQVTLLKNQLNVVMIQLGSAILPALTKAVQDLIKWVEENKEGIKEFGAAAVRVIGFLGGNFIKGLVQVIETLAEVANAFDWIPKNEARIIASLVAIGATMVLVFGPQSAAFAAVAGLVALIGFLGSVNPGDISGRPSQGGGGGFLGIGGFLDDLNQGIIDTSRKIPIIGNTYADYLENFDKQNKAQKESTDNIEEQIHAQDKLKESAQGLSRHTLPEVDFGFQRTELGADEAGAAADKAGDKLRELSQEFVSASEAAGKITSLTEGMNLFGNISIELARAMGITAEAAGAVQGYDALVRATERADRKAFDFASTMATVANAFEQSAAIGKEIVLSLARSALDASQSAASAIFGRPTREVASLSLTQAQVNLDRIQIARLIEPQIEALTEQLEKLNDASKNQIDSISENIERLRDSRERQTQALDDQIDSIRESNEALRDANKEQERILRERASTLEREQRVVDDQIESLIEFLDYADITQDQRDAIEDNIEALQRNRRHLVLEQNQAEKMADELEARDQALENAVETQIKSLQDQKEAIERSTDSQVEALESQRKAIEDSVKSEQERIESQISALEAQLEIYDDQAEAIQHQIDLYEANSDILERQIDLADQTLLTQEEQRLKAEELIGIIQQESGVVRDLTQQLGRDLLPEMDEAREAFKVVREAVEILNNPSLRANLIPAIDAAALREQILTQAKEKETGAASGAAGALGGLETAAIEAGNQLGFVARAGAATKEQMEKFPGLIAENTRILFDGLAKSAQGIVTAGANAVSTYSGTQIIAPGSPAYYQWLNQPAVGMQGGGIVTTPGMRMLGEGYKPEAVIPLTNPERAREIVASIPPAFLGAMMGNSRGGGGGGVTLNVDTVNIIDPRRSTGPVGDMAYSINRAVKSRGILT